MQFVHSSLKALAFIAIFVLRGSFVTATSSPGLLAPRAEPAEASAIVEGIPAPTTKPDFQYKFQIIFSGGHCSEVEQTLIKSSLAYLAGAADRIQLWKNDVFHDWDHELNYYFGQNAAEKQVWIKSNKCPDLLIDLKFAC